MDLKIIIPQNSRLSKIAAEKLNNYLSKVSGKSYSIIEDSNEIADSCNFIIIGNEKRNRFTRKIGFSYEWDNMRPDGYVLRTINKDGKKYVIAAGNSEAGDKYAVYRLIKELSVKEHDFFIEDYDITMNPFIKTREVIMGDACPWDPLVYEDEVPEKERGMSYDDIFDTQACKLNFPDTAENKKRKKAALWRILEKYCIENWDKKKLIKYADQMDFYGFNSIEFYEDSESYLHSGCFATRREYREKLLEMMKRNREIGNRNTLMTWAVVPFFMNPSKRAVSDWDDPSLDEKIVFARSGGFHSYCWNDEKERKNAERNIEYQSGYAPYVDCTITHLNDPGGCNRNGCTISTCMEIMNYLYYTFKEKNPKIKTIYNLWPLTSEHKGYRITDIEEPPISSGPGSWNKTYSWQNFLKVVDKLDKEIMIANRKYNPVLSDYCKKWKRKYGIWSWYNCDQECTASLHVEAERLRREFRKLPDNASENIEWFSVPSNCHSLNSASLYIASCLLWEPKRETFGILREFCELVFGPRISNAVFSGYSAIAKIRNHDVNGDSAFDDSYLGSGTDNPEEDLRISKQAMESLKDTEIDNDWVSKIPMAVEREEILEDLKDHLEMVYQYAAFRVEYAKLAEQGKICPEELKKLPKVDKLSVSGGMIEWRKVQAILRNQIKE